MREWREGVAREETMEWVAREKTMKVGAKVEPSAGIPGHKPMAELREGGAMMEPYQAEPGG